MSEIRRWRVSLFISKLLGKLCDEAKKFCVDEGKDLSEPTAKHGRTESL